MSTPKTRGKSETGVSYAACLIRSFSQVQSLSSSDSDDESDKDTEAVAQAKTWKSDKNQMDQNMDIDEAQMKIQSRNMAMSTQMRQKYMVVTHMTQMEALPSGSDDAGAWEANPEKPGKQCTFL